MGRVVNVKHDLEYDVYIGHQLPWRPYKLKKSIWANPFNKAMRAGELSRTEAIERYKDYVLETPALRERLPELKGKVLGCWCKPEPCHGDVLGELAEQEEEEE
jgi:hypothetical protein